MSTFTSSWLAQWFTPRGRVRRRVFCFFVLGYIIVTMLILMLGGLLIRLNPLGAMLLVIILQLPLIGAWICVQMRRYHDFGISGWLPGSFILLPHLWMLLADPAFGMTAFFTHPKVELAATIFSALNLIVLYFVPALTPGFKGSNRYGADPKAPSDGPRPLKTPLQKVQEKAENRPPHTLIIPSKPSK